MDGPVVTAARRALERGNVNLILPWAPKSAEKELREAFQRTLRIRRENREVEELANHWFFETAVRLHRQGEGKPYTGLKPAGLDWGPVVPKADEAVEQGDPSEVIEFLSQIVREELRKRFDGAMAVRRYDEDDVNAAREFIEAMLGFVLYSHHLYDFATGHVVHDEGHQH